MEAHALNRTTQQHSLIRHITWLINDIIIILSVKSPRSLHFFHKKSYVVFNNIFPNTILLSGMYTVLEPGDSRNVV